VTACLAKTRIEAKLDKSAAEVMTGLPVRNPAGAFALGKRLR